MLVGNPIESLTTALFSAAFNPEFFPDVEYVHTSWSQKTSTKKTRRPRVDELHALHFLQSWGSTALGLDGIGGAAMCDAYTTVIYLHNVASVFFNGVYAYTVEIDENFDKDCKSQLIKSVGTSKYKKYDKKIPVQL